MPVVEITWFAVIVAAAVKFAIGAVWYTALFGKQWRALQGVAEGSPMTGLGQAMAVQIVGDLIMAYILARFVGHYGWGFGTGLIVGFMAWLGFVATVTIGQVFYERRPFMVFVINNGYLLVGLLMMGAILGWWHAGVVAAVAPAPA
jgi:hypothetical protein